MRKICFTNKHNLKYVKEKIPMFKPLKSKPALFSALVLASTICTTSNVYAYDGLGSDGLPYASNKWRPNYKETCKNMSVIKVDGIRILEADCKILTVDRKDTGKWHHNSLRLDDAPGRPIFFRFIHNYAGILKFVV